MIQIVNGAGNAGDREGSTQHGDRPQEMPRAAYLHVPFCRRRCFYCDFPVSVAGDRAWGEESQAAARYVDRLCREASLEIPPDRPLQTVFIGGGTPSLLSVGQITQILSTVRRNFGIAPGAEISIEMDPGTFDRAKLQGFLAAGVNRISLGVQAFQDELLQACGRSHTAAEAEAAIALLKAEGIANFSIDLICGLPHQTTARWRESLERAIASGPAHVSAYDLIVEPKTVFARYYRPGESPLPTEERAADMYRTARRMLADAGYEHYEISNYARPGFACRHNLTYWENRPYYGFGMGAASYVRGHRRTRPRTTPAYAAWVEALENGRTPPEVPESFATDGEELADEFLETLMLGLRLAKGVSLAAICDRYGDRVLAPLWRCLQRYVKCGWVVVAEDEPDRGKIAIATALPSNGWLRLSDPEGFLFSNTVLSELFRYFDERRSSERAFF